MPATEEVAHGHLQGQVAGQAMHAERTGNEPSARLRERELGVVTGGPHGDIFWNVTAKLRRRLQARAAPKREALTFYWETIAAQMRQP